MKNRDFYMGRVCTKPEFRIKPGKSTGYVSFMLEVPRFKSHRQTIYDKLFCFAEGSLAVEIAKVVCKNSVISIDAQTRTRKIKKNLELSCPDCGAPVSGEYSHNVSEYYIQDIEYIDECNLMALAPTKISSENKGYVYSVKKRAEEEALKDAERESEGTDDEENLLDEHEQDMQEHL